MSMKESKKYGIKSTEELLSLMPVSTFIKTLKSKKIARSHVMLSVYNNQELT